MPTLGVLAVYMHGRKIEELNFFRKLSICGAKEGVQVALFTPGDVNDHKQEVSALIYNEAAGRWVRKSIPIPPLIYDRCRYHGVSTFRMLSAFRRGHAKLNYLAKPLANKWTLHNILGGKPELSKHLPETHMYSPAVLEKMLKKHKTIYLKPKNGTGGRGIVRIERINTDKYRIQGRKKNRAILPIQYAGFKQLPARLHACGVSRQYIAQQGISSSLSDGRVYDFRLLIQKNAEGAWEVTGCAGRIGPSRSITSNLHGGGKAVTMNALLSLRFHQKDQLQAIKDELYSFSMQTAAYLEEKFGMLCELGIDLAVDSQGKVWLIEVNPKPSREVFRRIGEINTYKKAILRPIQFAKYLLEQKKQP